jgi:hypothetical protein
MGHNAVDLHDGIIVMGRFLCGRSGQYFLQPACVRKLISNTVGRTDLLFLPDTPLTAGTNGRSYPTVLAHAGGAVVVRSTKLNPLANTEDSSFLDVALTEQTSDAVHILLDGVADLYSAQHWANIMQCVGPVGKDWQGLINNERLEAYARSDSGQLTILWEGRP